MSSLASDKSINEMSARLKEGQTWDILLGPPPAGGLVRILKLTKVKAKVAYCVSFGKDETWVSSGEFISRREIAEKFVCGNAKLQVNAELVGHGGSGEIHLPKSKRKMREHIQRMQKDGLSKLRMRDVEPPKSTAAIEHGASAPTHDYESIKHLPLDEYWKELTNLDISKTAPKAMAYGSKGEDLIAIGRAMCDLGIPVAPGVSPEQFHTYLGTYFYLVGKLARMSGALKRGLLPSPDTTFDTRIYSVILQRTQDTGHWG